MIKFKTFWLTEDGEIEYRFEAENIKNAREKVKSFIFRVMNKFDKLELNKEKHQQSWLNFEEVEKYKKEKKEV